MMHAFSLRPFLGSLLGTGALALSLLLGSCSDKPQETVNLGELAARTAKIYYDSLAAGRFDSFYEGKLKADTVPETYRQQMKAILKQFADNEQKRHKGIDPDEPEPTDTELLAEIRDLLAGQNPNNVHKPLN